jgi:hypothetical protein
MHTGMLRKLVKPEHYAELNGYRTREIKKLDKTTAEVRFKDDIDVNGLKQIQVAT